MEDERRNVERDEEIEGGKDGDGAMRLTVKDRGYTHGEPSCREEKITRQRRAT